MAVVFVLFVQSLFVKFGAGSFGHIYLTFVLLSSVLRFSLFFLVFCERRSPSLVALSGSVSLASASFFVFCVTETVSSVGNLSS